MVPEIYAPELLSQEALAESCSFADSANTSTTAIPLGCSTAPSNAFVC